MLSLLEGNVDLVQFLGNEALVDIVLPGQSELDRPLAALVSVAQCPPGGAPVRFTFDEARMHLFDASTGLSLLAAPA